MKLSGETKLFIGIGLATVLLLVGAVVLFSFQESASKNVPTFSREELMPENTAIKGNASASAFLVEFSDFQCPACRSYAPLVEQLKNSYGDRLAIGYRHFPLAQHDFAEQAARAAEAARQQGKFWEMHDELFANQDKLSEEIILQAVARLNLDQEAFQKAYTANETRQLVENDRISGIRFNVNSTPTFFLNGKKLPSMSGEKLIETVEKALQ